MPTTILPPATTSPRIPRTRRAGATAVAVIGGLAAALGLTAPANAGDLDSYIVDTGWVNDWNGGCRAKAHVEYFPSSDTATFETTVVSPYWFAACRVNTRLTVQTRSNSFDGAVHYAMACSVSDPLCAATQTRPGRYSGQTPGLSAYVESVNEGLREAGAEPTYTRKKAVSGIRVTFSKA